jgi:hypothetical protein
VRYKRLFLQCTKVCLRRNGTRQKAEVSKWQHQALATSILDVADIIEEAYERCGLEVRTGYDAKTARRSLNIMFSEWANRGVNLWTVKQATLTLISGTATYNSGNGLASPMNDILEVALRRSGTDYEVDRISRGEYLNVPNKTTTGRPSQFYFNRQTSPELVVWPTPENSTDELVYYYITRIEDADTSQNTTDVPYRFLPCMIAGFLIICQ